MTTLSLLLHDNVLAGAGAAVLLRAPRHHHYLKICASSDVQHARRRVKSSVHQQAALCAVQLCCCRGLFSAWNRMVSRERSGGWALQCTAVLVALLRTPTLFHSCSASDSLSISRSISRPLSHILASFVLPSSLHFLPISFVLLIPIFSHTLFKPTTIHRLFYFIFLHHLSLPSVTHTHT